MDKKGFDALDEAQAARDFDFLDHVKGKILPGLFKDLEHAIPGYFDMSNWDKFCELMAINEKHAYEGNAIMLDCGENLDGKSMCGLVFPGFDTSYHHDIVSSEGKSVKVFTPSVWVGDYGVEGNPITNSISYFFNEMEEAYSALPIPFKVALVAAYIRQYVIVRNVDACKFAAGMSETLPIMRWDAKPLGAGNTQFFGWRVKVRDTAPTNELATHIARHLRSVANEADNEPWGYLADGRKRFTEQEIKQRRRRHTSTELLEDFIKRYLPENGHRLAKVHNGGEVKITWKEAYALFDDMYPGIYQDWETFRKSYFNAKKRYGW